MKRFSFHLQPVLDMRKRRERAEQMAFARLLAEKQRAMSLLHKLQDKYGAILSKLSQLDYDAAERFELERDLSEVEDYLTKEKTRLQPVLEEMDQKIAKQQAVLGQLRRKSKIVEKLKERAWTQYNREVRNEEEKELNELNQNMFHWRKNWAIMEEESWMDYR